MSLVNDMLRDLDARRRDAPASGIGAERLMPASEGGHQKKAPGIVHKFLLAALLLAGIVLIGWALWPGLETQTSRQINIPMQAQMPEQTPVQAAVAPEQAVAAELLQELDRMTQRMNALEEQNQALREAESTVSAEMIVPAPSSSSEAAAPGNIAAWESRNWTENESVAAQPAQQVQVPVPVFQAQGGSRDNQPSVVTGGSFQVQEVETASTLQRSPRELSFRDNDRQIVQQALQSWQHGQRAAALQQLEAFTTANPEAHQSREMLAKLLLQQGDTIAALQLTDAGLQVSPEHAGYKKIKARILMAAGVPADAVELLTRRAPTVAADTEYHELLAAARLAAEDYENALLTYQALATIQQNESRYWYGVASSLDALGRSYEAQQAYERALQLGNLSAGLIQATQQRLLALRQN